MSDGEAPTTDAVDRDACMGSGNCVFWAPGVFDLDEDGIAVVVGDVTGRDEDLRKAAANCPTSAIRLDRLRPFSG
jgi:ferredoxin